MFLTHFHADFVAGHLELRDRTGATIHLGAAARAEYAHVSMKEGDALEFGRVRLRVLETPGHTPESISILVYDAARSSKEPYAVLSGDTLFVGDVGRPDLRASLGWSATELGRLLYTSLRTKLLPLPDDTLVYPAHGAGSLCGKSLSSETVSTIGAQRHANYALQPMSQEEFVALVTADQPDAPAYFTYDAVLNSRERPTLDAALKRELTPLSVDQVMELAGAGATLLDVRDPAEFAHSHLRGSINIGLGESTQRGLGRCSTATSQSSSSRSPNESSRRRSGSAGSDPTTPPGILTAVFRRSSTAPICSVRPTRQALLRWRRNWHRRSRWCWTFERLVSGSRNTSAAASTFR